MPTTALVATSTGVPTSATEPALSTFQAPDGCLPDVFFQVSYDAEQWSLHDDRLSHRQQPECSLLLIPHGIQMSPPMQTGAIVLAGQAWETRHFPTDGMISYLPRRDGACYFFGVSYPKGASDETLAACRQAAETVIDTFSSTTPAHETLLLASVSSDGAALNSTPFWLYNSQPSISASGRYVAFHTSANLVAADHNQQPDVYVHDVQTGATELVSTGPNGAAGVSQSMSTWISPDARFVAFTSTATDLLAHEIDPCALGDDDPCTQVYLRDRQNGSTELVSVAPDGSPGNRSSFGRPSLSADGRFVVFTSDASNLTQDTPAPCLSGQSFCRHVFVRDRLTGATQLVSKASNGEPGNGESDMPTISADGRWIAYQSYASNLVDAPVDGRQIYVHDLLTGRTNLISTPASFLPGGVHHDMAMPALSADGHEIVFNVVVYPDQTSNTPPPADPPGFLVVASRDGSEFAVVMEHIGFWPSISADGRWITFSTEVALAPEDANGANDVYLFDRLTGAFRWISRPHTGTQATGGGTYASVSNDGQSVAFDSMAALLPEDQWLDADTYLWAGSAGTGRQ